MDRPVIPGANRLMIVVPSTAAIGQTYARFRVSTVRGLSPDGPAPDGEVEDYRVEIISPWSPTPTETPTPTPTETLTETPTPTRWLRFRHYLPLILRVGEP